MCGIAGIVQRAPVGAAELDRLGVLRESMTHRGPDGSGDFRAEHVALAMRRLSIIDLAGGWQPLYNEDRSLALVANGEVYNFIELRERLQAKGHHFATGSDCETILHLYEEYGDACVDHLRGMYAFALWDGRNRRLLLCRDRMGEKPLYLAESDGRLVFASELRSLLRAGVVSFDPDPAALHDYFHFHWVPDPNGIVRGVRKLPPGHLLVVEPDPWRVREHRYWRMEDAPPLEGDPPQLVREALEDVSRLVIRSDVPVGMALSSGLDSSVLACLSAKNHPGQMHAFSVGYRGEPLQDERRGAKELADHLGMPFHDVEICPADVVDDFPTLCGTRDEPNADFAAFSLLSVARAARRAGVPVLLTGNGGDELSWGYAWVRRALRRNLNKLRMRTGDGGVGLSDYLQVTPPPRSYTAGVRWLKSLGGLLSGLQDYRQDRFGPADRLAFWDMTPDYRDAARYGPRVFHPHFLKQVAASGVTPARLFTIPQPWPPLNVALISQISQTYLLQNGLTLGDRLSMATSVELRVPLVDYKLVETFIGLEKSYPDPDRPAKHWFREAMKDVLPPFVLARRKRGFTPPWRQWYNASFARYGPQLLDGYLVQNRIITPEAAQRLVRRVGPIGMPVPMGYAALCLEMWCRQMQSTASAAKEAAAPASGLPPTPLASVAATMAYSR